MLNLKERDANILGEEKTSFIDKNNHEWITSHNEKNSIVHTHFSLMLKKRPPRLVDLNWITIPTPKCDPQQHHEIRCQSGHVWIL
jgi:hypothetical protein